PLCLFTASPVIMLRVVNGVLVVPPFECAWLTGEGYTLRSGAGCISFEAKGDTDVTVILKSTPGAKRLQPLLRQAAGNAQGHGGGGNALQVEQNYTIIFGSHRNSCLKVEKNGVTQCMVAGVACSRVSNKAFTKYWVDLNHGVLTIGHGDPGEGICHQWCDAHEIPGIQHIGLSCWDRHVSYRSMSLHPPLDFTRLQQQQQHSQLGLSGGCSITGASAVPPLFDATCSAIMAATTPANVCRTLHVAELLLPTTQKLYRYCLDYIARHFEAVVRQPTTVTAGAAEVATEMLAADAAMLSAGPQQQPDAVSEDSEDLASLSSMSPAAMCDLVCQNTFSVDEQGIYVAVRDWAWSYLTSAAEASAAATCREEAVSAVSQQQQEGSSLLSGCGHSNVAAADPWGATQPPQPPQLARASLDAVPPPCPAAIPGVIPAGALSAGWGPSGGGGGGGGGGVAASWRSVTGGSHRRLSDPHLDCTALKTALAQAVAAAGSAAAPAAAPAPGTPLPAATPPNLPCAAAPSATAVAVVSCVEGVLSLIRYPLLPIDQLHACLRDPLLCRLPGVLGLVHEALEVHRRETGAGGAVMSVPMVPTTGAATAAMSGGCSSGSAAPMGCGGCSSNHAHGGMNGGGGGGLLSPTAAERRLVKPLLSPKAGVNGAEGGGVGGMGGGGATAGMGVATGGAGGSGGTADGGGAAAEGHGGGAAIDNRWSVRYQRRCLPFALELMYVCDGDSCGVLHFLGTQYGSQGWVNPLLAKRVDVRASSPTGRTTDPRVVVGRQFVRTNFAGPRYVNGAASSWWQVDLGEPHQLAITYYTLRHDGSSDFARSWVLQGSHDLATWVDLKRHSNDTSIKLPGQYASWPVIGPAAAVPYRAFRLLLTAPNASPNSASRLNFCLSNLELYGFLHKGGGIGNGNSSGSSNGSAAVVAAGGGEGAGAPAVATASSGESAGTATAAAAAGAAADLATVEALGASGA
ncbi:hypothetical protein Agub_g14789, partial [Astrephomene gubernaculifera]